MCETSRIPLQPTAHSGHLSLTTFWTVMLPNSPVRCPSIHEKSTRVSVSDPMGTYVCLFIWQNRDSNNKQECKVKRLNSGIMLLLLARHQHEGVSNKQQVLKELHMALSVVTLWLTNTDSCEKQYYVNTVPNLVVTLGATTLQPLGGSEWRHCWDNLHPQLQLLQHIQKSYCILLRWMVSCFLFIWDSTQDKCNAR